MASLNSTPTASGLDAPDFRQRLRGWLEHPRFTAFITALIGLNAVTLGLETWPLAMQTAGPFLLGLDTLVLSIFVLEIGLKLFSYGPRFFRSGWNLFDLSIVALALLPVTHSLSALRALRILRAFRLISTIPQLRHVVESLLAALPGMGAVLAMLALVFYVSAVVATNLFAAQFPEWFGSVGASMYSLFQIMTLESWSMGIVRPVMEVYSWAWMFFVPFIIVTSFTVLNLFIALIVTAMQHNEAHTQAQPIPDALTEPGSVAHLTREIALLRSELSEMRERLEDDRRRL